MSARVFFFLFDFKLDKIVSKESREQAKICLFQFVVTSTYILIVILIVKLERANASVYLKKNENLPNSWSNKADFLIQPNEFSFFSSTFVELGMFPLQKRHKNVFVVTAWTGEHRLKSKKCHLSQIIIFIVNSQATETEQKRVFQIFSMLPVFFLSFVPRKMHRTVTKVVEKIEWSHKLS